MIGQEFTIDLEGKLHAKIVQIPLSTRYRIAWTDGVASSWHEDYETLSEALSRLALLVACAESSYEKFFRSCEPEEHTASHLEFLEVNLS